MRRMEEVKVKEMHGGTIVEALRRHRRCMMEVEK